MNRRRMKENPKVLKRQKKIEKVEGHKSCWVRKKGGTHTPKLKGEEEEGGGKIHAHSHHNPKSAL